MFWQGFFSLFFGRSQQPPGTFRNPFYGYRFFTHRGDLIDALRGKLVVLGKLHQESVEKIARELGSLPASRIERKPLEVGLDFHKRLAILFHSMYLWLNEPRIQTKDFDTSMLPPEFDPPRLRKAMNDNLFETALETQFTLQWVEFLNLDVLQGSFTEPHHHQKNRAASVRQGADPAQIEKSLRHEPPQFIPHQPSILPLPLDSPNLFQKEVSSAVFFFFFSFF